MTKRDVVRAALDGKAPPYVPWSFGFTEEAREKLVAHFGRSDLKDLLGNHFYTLGSPRARFEPLGQGLFRDEFGVVWDRSVDKDIGVVKGCVIPEPAPGGFTLPEPAGEADFAVFKAKLDEHPDRFRVFAIGFSLYERAWTLRGMENLMVDFLDHPDFVHELLDAIADRNIAEVREALKHDFDAVYFGDDWGSQRGLQMGPGLWREFIRPRLSRMYGAAREAGRYVFIHSCGKVDELFDDLIEIGLSCFNPFQPEVMDVERLLVSYRGRLAFHGGLSTQKTLPYGSADDVRSETARLLELGGGGGYIFAPAHAVEGDVPLENMLAFIELLKAQPGYAG